MLAKKLFVVVAAGIISVFGWQFAQFALIMPASVSAQTEKEEEKKKSDISPELREKAVKFLTAVAKETQQFTLPENRIRAQINAADLLWEDDEREARTLFQNALTELQALFGNLATSTENSEDPNYYTERYTLSDLRQKYLLKLAPRDPKAALAALQALRTFEPSKEEYDPLKEDGLELQLASAIAKKDPQQGYELALKNLKEGVTYNTFQTLTDLHKTDSEIGAKFARDVLAKFKTTKIRSPAGNSNVSMSNMNMNSSGGTTTPEVDLSQAAQFMRTASELNRLAVRNKKTAALTDGEMREMADFIAQTFSRQRSPEPWSISSAMTLITKYSPTAAAMIRRKLNPQQLQMLDSYGDSGNYYEERDSKTIDELLAEAEKLTSPDERDLRYADAIGKALEKDDVEKAQQIGEKIKNRTAYEYVFDQIKAAEPLIKAKRGDIAEVKKLLATLKTDDEKVAALTKLVIAVAEKGDKEAAGRIADEANQFLPARMKRKPNLDTTINIASAFTLVQPERGFGLLESTIGQMNDLIAAGIMIDEFYDYQTVKNDELLFDTMERQGLIHTPDSVMLIKHLAMADFDRMVALSDRFARPEIRTFARLKIAEALLDPEAVEREKELRQQYESEQGDH